MSADLKEAEERIRELGFGRAGKSKQRLLNRDGTFNVQRRGLSYAESRTLFNSLVTMSWPQFLAVVVACYLGVNRFFALLYALCDEEALIFPADYPLGRFAGAFFFSVQTLATIGYGQILPVGLLANLLVTVEALIGLLAFSIATGFLFARISRPTARILFSERALIAPFEGGTALMFRLANARSSQLIEVEARVILSRFEGEGAARKREYYTLDLEYSKVTFLSLSWTVVHPIGPESPFAGVPQEELVASEAEILILLTATDDVFSQTVHARSSYKAEEIVWAAKFVSMYSSEPDGAPLAVDIGRLSEFEYVGTAKVRAA